MLARVCFLLAGLAGGSAVLLGALEAHMLRPQLDHLSVVTPNVEKRLENAQTAVRYQLLHAAVLFGVGLAVAGAKKAHFLLRAGAVALPVGMLLFCGALHINGYTGNESILQVAPAGGMCMIMGWLAVGCGAFLSYGER